MIIVGVLVGRVLGASTLSTTVGELLVWGATCAGLTLAVIVGRLLVHPWWGAVLAWGAFMAGVVPPLSDQDALWAVGAFVLALLAAGYVAVLNSVVSALDERRRRRLR